MAYPLHLATLACGTTGLFGSREGLIVLGILTLAAAALFGLIYAISRIWCRPKLASRVALLVVIASGVALTPAFRMARIKSLRASANCHLKQIGLALAQYADEHQGILPSSLRDPALQEYMGSGKILIDPVTGEPFVYVGAGRVFQSKAASDEILAYSPRDNRGRDVLFNDAHVQWLTSQQFTNALRASGQL